MADGLFDKHLNRAAALVGLWPILCATPVAFVTAWAALTESGVPLWLCGFVALGMMALVLLLINAIQIVWAKSKQPKPINSGKLAEQLEKLSQDIATSLGEFQFELARFPWEEEHFDAEVRQSRSLVKARLVQRYQSHYAAHAWALISEAGKVISLDMSDLWRVQHGIRSENDVSEVHMLLGRLAGAVRTPNKMLPMTDIRLEEMRRSQAAVKAPE